MAGHARGRKRLGSDLSAALVRGLDGERPFEATRGGGEGRLRAVGAGGAGRDRGRLRAAKLFEDEAAVIQRTACPGSGGS